MDNIEWIIAVVVFAMLVYPIMQMMPTEKQKRQAMRRQQAITKGMKVRIQHPEFQQYQMSLIPEISRAAGYFLPLVETCLDDDYFAFRPIGSNEWQWLNGIAPRSDYTGKLLPLYTQLPAYCMAVQQGPIGTGLFFDDGMIDCDIDVIRQKLEQLNSVIKI